MPASNSVLGPDSFDVRLPDRIGGARADIGVEGATLKEVGHQMPGAFGAVNIGRTGAAQYPA